MPDNAPKWTPGPWKVWAMQVCSAAPEHGGDEKRPDDSDVVATTYQRDANGQCITADAHLCAAAPELYALLDDALGPVVAEEGNCYCPTKSGRPCLPCRIRAALLKANPARGEQPNAK